MKKYLADLLTFIRFALSFFLIYLALSGRDVGEGLVVFLIAELTDAFDGTFASLWPFEKSKEPWYRKYAARYDMITDFLLIFAMFLFFILRVNLEAGLIIGAVTLIGAAVVELTIYGKFFGHPDNATENSLIKKNFKLAKKIVLIRRNIYLGIIALLAIWTLIVSEWSLVVKIIILIISVAVAIFLWFFLKQRRKNISRDAVDIEKSLEKSTKK